MENLLGRLYLPLRDSITTVYESTMQSLKGRAMRKRHPSSTTPISTAPISTTRISTTRVSTTLLRMFLRTGLVQFGGVWDARLRREATAGRKLHYEICEPRVMLAADLNGFELYPPSALTSDSSGVHQTYAPPARQLLNYGGFLTEPSQERPLDIARKFLGNQLEALGLDTEDLSGMVISDMYRSAPTGTTHIYFRQRHNGLPVLNSDININVSTDGRIVNVGSSFLAGLQGNVAGKAGNSKSSVRDVGIAFYSTDALPRISAAEAVIALANDYGWSSDVTAATIARDLAPANRGQRTLVSASSIAREDIAAELQYVPLSNGKVELAWRLNVQTVDGQHWYDANVSATNGRILGVTDWVSHARYHVFAAPKESPNDGPRTVEIDPHNTIASPFGWHDTNGNSGAEFTITRGNNVWAYADRNGDDLPDAGSSPNGLAALDFNSPLDLTQAPLNYQAASVTNLFYWSNQLHDILYRYGFDEAAGNFQANNYGHTGVANDALLAESQDQADGGPDGPQRSNANFSSPPDGQNPRLQMFLWNDATPDRDSALDNGILIHEYTHGLSNRLTSGPSNAGALDTLQSAGLGEGWSDWMALMLTQIPSDAAGDRRPVGNYALGQSTAGGGIRTLPYSYSLAINDLTFGDIIDQLDEHFLGEVWASTLWDLNWALIGGNSLDPNLPQAGLGFSPDLLNGNAGNTLALQLVIDGMKLQRTTPTFLEARDAILSADMVLTGGANQLTIWTVFARRGMGYSADDGGSSNASFVTEAFDLPATRDGTVKFDQPTVDEGSLLSVTLRDSDLTGNQIVQVTTSSGDTETITLLAQPTIGIFKGQIDTGAGPVGPSNGVLQVAAGSTATVTYLDANTGTGGINVAKTDILNVTMRLARGLPEQTPLGASLSTSNNLARLSSAVDVEPFTFFAEAGEKIGVSARPFGSALIDLQLVGLTGVIQAPAAGGVASIPLVAIPATGQYKVLLGGNAAVSAELNLARNVVDEEAIGDASAGNPLVLTPSVVAVGNGTRYAAAAQSVPVGLGIINGGFETGDFTGWEILAAGNALVPWTVSGAGSGSGYGLIPTQPPQGSFAAWNGFDGAGPMEFLLSQNVLLPANPVTLAWKDRVQWNFGFVGGIATEGRTAQVQVRHPDGALLATLYSFDTQPEYITVAGDTGWQSHSVSLGDFAGQLVQLVFVQRAPQIFTGPGQFEIDDIALQNMPAAAPDVDEFEIDLTGRSGKQLDIVLASDRGEFSAATLELLRLNSATLLASGSTTPLAPATPVRNYAVGILNYIVPADGIYRVRVTSSVYADYRVVVNESVIFDSEPNDVSPVDLLRSLDRAAAAIGHVDGVNQYNLAETQFGLEDLSDAALYLFLGEDQVSNARAIGFNFNFFGQTYSSFYVSSNGFLTFLANQSDGCCFGKPIPDPSNPNAIIAGWWRDLQAANASLGQFIRYKTIGAAGKRVLVVEFRDVPHFTDPSLKVTMQFKLFEANGDIELHYLRAPGDEQNHSAGIENQTGSQGVQYYFGRQSLPENLAIRYSRASVSDRYQLTLAAGQEVTLLTRTPFDAPGHATPSTLNPELRVLHPDGVTVLGSDLNSLDGKNAKLTVVAPVAGVYIVEIKATTGVGSYAIEKYEPAHVTEVQFGDGTAQRSRVNQINIAFDQIVELQSGAFELNLRESGGSVGAAIGLATPQIDNSTGRTIATLTFTGTNIFGGSLPDGNYALRILANRVLVVGRALDGDSNGAAGGDYNRGTLATDNFFRLFGDIEGNRGVGLIEFGTGRLATGTVPGIAGYDERFDYDGIVGIGLLDFGQLRLRFGRSLSFD